MSSSVVYDISRLATRFSRLTPNGIDRVDLEFARHFVVDRCEQRSMLLTPLGPRAVSSSAARCLVEAVQQHWREIGNSDDDPIFAQLKLRLAGDHNVYRHQQAARWRHTLRSMRAVGGRLFGANGV